MYVSLAAILKHCSIQKQIEHDVLFMLLEIALRKQNPAMLDSKSVIVGDMSASEIEMGITYQALASVSAIFEALGVQ